MNKKIDKVCAEIDKTKAKISEYNVRLRELEKQKTELENTEIVELVRGVEASPRPSLRRSSRRFGRNPGRLFLWERRNPNMKKLTRFKRAVALVFFAALLCVPLLGLAAPAAESGTLDSTTIGESAAPETTEETEPETKEPSPEPPA